MNSNKVPEGKTVYIAGRKFLSGETLPSWALLEIPEMEPEQREVDVASDTMANYDDIKQKEIKVGIEVVEEKKQDQNYHNRKKKRR